MENSTNKADIPNFEHFRDYLSCIMKHNFVIASNRLKRKVGPGVCIEIEWYAFDHGYTFRSPNGLLMLNRLKEWPWASPDFNKLMKRGA